VTNKELFTKYYNAHLDFEQAAETLLMAGVQTDDSMFSTAFYTIFDTVMDSMLTEEGQDHLYEDILFQKYPLEEALEALEEYFI
jgi:hypothetical protein